MNLIIPINKKYRINLDAYSWSIGKWKKRKSHLNGGEWETVTCHKTIQQVGEELVIRLVLEEDLEGVDEIINALSASSQLIANAIAEFDVSNYEYNIRSLMK